MADAFPEVIQDILPAKEVSILAGSSGSGKTTLLMQILYQMQHNQPIFGHPVLPNLKIGYIAADRTWMAYERLAHVVGVNLSQIKVRALIDDEDIDTEHFERDPMGLLLVLIKEMLPLDLVIVDPLVVFFGCDTRLYHTNAARLIKLNRWCRMNNITILGTHHATKARTDYGFKRVQDRINGSGALLGFTSTQLFLADPGETGKPFSEWHIISHHAAPKFIALQRSKTTGLFEIAHPGLVQVAKEHPKASKGQEITQVVLKVLQDGYPHLLREIIASVAHLGGRTTVLDTLDLLVQQDVITKEGHGVYRLVMVELPTGI